MDERMNGKEFTTRFLNGLSLGIVLVLMPNAIFGELFALFIPFFPPLESTVQLFRMANSLMPIAIGVAVSMQFKLTPIQTISVALAALAGSGVVAAAENGSFVFSGTGNVINTGFTALIAVVLVLVVGNKLQAYNLLFLPSIVLSFAGGIGLLTLPTVDRFTLFIGEIISSITELQPILMGSLLAVSFAVLIVSPISTVGIATAIGLAGVGAGTANLGCVAAGFGLAVAGWPVNNTGTSLAHFIGSPKIQMANTIKKPLIMLPILCNASILGALGGFFRMQGTPISAGFGISGLLGPVNALNLAAGGWSPKNILLVSFLYIALPLLLAFLFQRVFTKIIPLVEPMDYKISFD